MRLRQVALIFAAGYETREAIEYSSWKLAVMAILLLGIFAVGKRN